ncbi:MAG: tail assembly chaperone [Muricomes sp.]
MFELTINGQVCKFNFGMGFLRDMNKKVTVPVEGMPGVKRDVGFRYSLVRLLDGDTETLVDILDAANKGQEPRLTRMALDSFVDDANTDIETVFDDVLGFLKTANATKKTVLQVVESLEEAKKKAEAEQ